jgi:hypothetical protein
MRISPRRAARRALSLGLSITQRDAICRLRPSAQYGMTDLGTPSRQLLSPLEATVQESSHDATEVCLTRYYTGGVAGEQFDGIPVGELPIDEVAWSEERAKHIRTRAERKGPAEINIEPLWASEAALDPNRLVRRGSGRESVEVLGYSPLARRVLLVWVYTTEHPPSGVWQGGSAIVAGRRLRAAYWEGQGDDRED